MSGRDAARRLRATTLAAIVTLSVLAVLIGGVGGAAAAGSTEINSCTVIDQPGTYELTGDIENITDTQMTGGADTPAVCVDIRSSDVVINGEGHVLDSEGGASAFSDDTAVYVNGTAEVRRNVTVKDVTLTDWPRGVWAQEASGVVVENVSVRLRVGSSTGTFPGVEFRTVSNSTVRDSNLSDPYRINHRGVNNPNNRYADNVVDRGIVIGSPNATVVNNSVGGSGATAQISVNAESATVSNNTIEEGYVAVGGGEGAHVEDNTIDNNNKQALLEFALTISGEGASVRNNTIADSLRGMQVSGSDHVLRENEILNNEQNFHVGDLGNDQPPGPIDVDTSNTVDGEPIYYLHGVADQTFAETDAGYLAIVDSSGITVRDVVLTNNTEGLLLANVSDVTIENATLEGNKYGLEAWEGENVTIRESLLSDNQPITEASGETGVGFFTRSSGEYTLEGNTITGNDQGISSATALVSVIDNDISDNSEMGLEIRSSNGETTVRNNSITANGDYGVRLGKQADATVDGNDISDNGEGGIFATTPNATFINNTITGHHFTGFGTNAGLWIGREGATPRGGIEGTNLVENNTVRNNDVGIRLWWNHPSFPGNRDELAIDDNLIVDNVVTENTIGISVREWAENNTIRNNHATGNDHGIRLMNVGNNHVLDNNASNNAQDGVQLSDYNGGLAMEADAFVVRNNTVISNGDDGIELDGARDSNDPSGPFYLRDNAARRNGDDGIVVNDGENVTVADNGRVSDNGGAGIRIEASSNVSVTNHTTTENGLGMFAGASALSIEDLNASANHGDGIVLNDADGLALRSDVTANDNDDDGLVLVDTSDASVEDVSTNDNSATGIEITADAIQSPQNVTLRNVTALRNGFGVRIVDTNEVTVSESTVGESPNADGAGIVVHDARNASVIDTTIEDNAGRGIAVTSTFQLLDSSSGAEIAGATVRNNGDDGIEYREFTGGSTIADTTIVDNGPNGVLLKHSSNVTVRNATIEGHSENGVEIVGDSDDNTIEQSDIRSHTNGNASGHGVFVRGISTEGAYASGTTIEGNTIADNDLGVTVFDDGGNAIRGNDILRNTKGVRIGSSGFQSLQENSVDCDGDPDTREGSVNLFGGTSEGAVVDNHIEGGDIALEMVTYPWRTEVCDGTTVDIDYSNPTIEDYRIVNNHIETTTLINVSTHHGAQFDGSNIWNASKTAEGNVLGGPYRAGNFWAKPDGSGFSQTCTDADGDGICDSSRTASTNNVDQLPLAANQPTAFVISIDSTNSPVTEGETLSVSATVENTGEAQISQTVALSIGGIEHDSTSVTLDSGESTTVSLNWTTTAGDAGDYDATVASEIGTASTSVTVESDGETSSPADFEVSVDSTNSPVLAGTDFEVTATIENTGDLADTQAVNLSVPGEIENTTDVSLEGGESTSVTLSLSTESLDNKTYTASIATDNMSVDTGLEVVEPEDAFFRTTVLETNSPVPNGSDVVVTANVENTGDLPATKEVSLTIHGETAIADENATDVSLGGGESTNVTLSVSTDSLDAGNYTSFMGVSSEYTDSTEVEIVQPEDAFFHTTIQETNSPVLNGTDFEVTAVVENTGELAATKEVSLTIHGETAIADENTTDVSLGAGETKTVTLSVSTDSLDAGNYTSFIGVTSDMSDSTRVEILDPEDTFFRTTIQETNSPVLNGTDFEVTATVENTGPVPATKEVTLTIHGETAIADENTTDVSLGAGEAKTVTLSVSTDSLDAGNYTSFMGVSSEYTDSTQVEILDPEDTFFSTTIQETNSPVRNGVALEVTATVENTGPVPATKVVRLTIHGETAIADENTTDVSLGAGETKTVTFSVSTDSLDAGNYTTFFGVASDMSDSTQIEIEAEQIDPTVELTAIDPGGSASTPPTGRTVHTNGTVSFEVTANGTPGDASAVDVTLEATFANFEYVVPATHQGAEVWTATADLTSLPDDGTYAVNVSAVDAAGNENETAAAATVDLDRGAPELGATVTKLGASTAAVNVTATEALVGPPAIEVEKPDGTTETATVVDSGETYWNATFALAQAGGQYDVTVTGTDPAGNDGTGNASTYVDTVETQNNTATVVLEPSGLFVNFTTDTDVDDTVVVTQSNTPLAPLFAGQAGVSFLNAQLGDALGGNLSHAVIGIPVDMSQLPASVDRDAVEIRYYNETASSWELQATTIEERTVLGTTQEYWIANVTHFSTYGAVATDDVAPMLAAATPSGQLSAGTTSHTVRFEYTDAISGVDAGAVRLVFDGTDVTGDASNTSITSQYASYDATGLDAGSYTASVTVPDVAGNEETYETTFTVPSADDDDGGSGDPGGSGSGGSSPAGGAPPDRFSRIIADQDPDESGVQVRFDDGPVQELIFEDEALDGSGDVIVEPHENPPENVADEFGSESVVSAVDIEVPDAARDASARISFHVTASELGNRDPETLQVVRVVDGENQRLTTEVNEGQDGDYVVEADTPGFSTFAVVSVQQQTEPTTEESTATEPETPSTDATAATTTDEPEPAGTAAPTTTETPGGLDGFGVTVALVAIVTAAIYAHRRRL